MPPPPRVQRNLSHACNRYERGLKVSPRTTEASHFASSVTQRRGSWPFRATTATPAACSRSALRRRCYARLHPRAVNCRKKKCVARRACDTSDACCFVAHIISSRLGAATPTSCARRRSSSKPFARQSTPAWNTMRFDLLAACVLSAPKTAQCCVMQSAPRTPDAPQFRFVLHA